MARFHTIAHPGRPQIDIPFTPEEEIARDIEEKDAIKRLESAIVAEDAKTTNRQSAMRKLTALGLSESEIRAIIPS